LPPKLACLQNWLQPAAGNSKMTRFIEQFEIKLEGLTEVWSKLSHI
jgi:hypothetical protein